MKFQISHFIFQSANGGNHSPRKSWRCALRRPPFARAFTLLEIMVAIAIFAMVIGAVYATFLSIMRAGQVGREATARAQRQRVALRTIEDSLMCVQSFQASQKYYSFIVANGSAPVLSFASRVPDVFPRNGKFGDFNLRRMTFSLEAASDGEKNLVLRQNPILMDMDEDEQKYPLVLARNVKTFVVDCWDTNQLDWVQEWDNTNSIPPMIRVGLAFGGNPRAAGAAEAAAAEYAVVRAFSIPSSMMPAIVQMGGAGAPGGGGLNPPLRNVNQPGRTGNTAQ